MLEDIEKLICKIIGNGSSSKTLVLVIGLILLIIIGLILIKIAVFIVRKVLKRSKMDPSLHVFVINAIKIVLVIVLITKCLSELGVALSTMITVVGAAGAAVALALRDSLANIAGGVMIIITKPFAKEDLIDIGDVNGKVDSIDLFLTTLVTYDNKRITIPNGLINTSILTNHSIESVRRVDCTFDIGYDNDIEKVKQILYDVAISAPKVLEKPKPFTGLASQGDHSLTLDLKVWCKTEEYWDVLYFLNENVKRAFDENAINIYSPHMDVHAHENISNSVVKE